MQRWYHPNLDSDEAERLLLRKGDDGSFLVRPSKSSRGSFSLSVKKGKNVRHIKIRHQGDFYDLFGGEQFATLTELVHYYIENQLKERDGEIVELKEPLNSSDPTTERWFHGSISGIVAERLIKEKGVTGSFLVRESQSKLGDYVLTIRTKDELSLDDKVTQYIIRHHNNKYDVGGGEKFDSLTELIEHYKKNPIVDTTGTVVNMKYPFNATRITAADIDIRVKELSKVDPQNNDNDGFWEEFEQLQHQEYKVLFSRQIGQKELNMSKNRYKNILPYDHTRVTLAKSAEDKSSDYINANYIKLVNDTTDLRPRSKPLPHSKVYIATQGPLANTVNDFWWMVWQENADCIVMVTKENERGKSKCYKYWPTLEQGTIRYGSIEVSLVKQDSAKANDDEYIIRKFAIKNLGSDENNDSHLGREIIQYQYLAWPDQGTPTNSANILSFLEDINRRSPRSPMIVHCSAGTGRTGTLIVIDMLMDQLNHNGFIYQIDIQKIVRIVRDQRSGLVQTAAQYKFIYLAIQSYIQRRRKSLV